MASLLWGNVYYKNFFAGLLKEEPGSRVSFTYDKDYLAAQHPAIAYSLPLQEQPFVSASGLPAFFDNLVAEGWLEQAQIRLLGKRQASRFELLLAYGYDCAGAVSVQDPEPAKLTQKLLDMSDPKEVAVLHNRSSLSGVQAKLALIERDGKLQPAAHNDLSTHIAKFASPTHADLLDNEYLTMQAFQVLLPEDDVAKFKFANIEGFSDKALVIERFDRQNSERIHFEEFNQLLALPSSAKYDGSYQAMANFIQNNQQCLALEKYRLFQRILAGLLLGNTDMHLKNFAMLHTDDGLRLTPSYDQVAAALYQYKTIALELGGAANLNLGKLKASNIIALGKQFGLSYPAIDMAVKALEKQLELAKETIYSNSLVGAELKNNLINLVDKRWRGTFALIGKALSKRQ